MFDFILPFDLSVAGAADKLRFSCGRFLTPVMKAITLSGNMGMIFVVSAFIMLFSKNEKIRRCRSDRDCARFFIYQRYFKARNRAGTPV